MKYLKIALFIGLFTTQTGFSQKQIELKEIWDGTFRTQLMQSVNTMPKSNQFSRIEQLPSETQVINVYDFKSLEKTKTVFDNTLFKDIRSIDDYSFDNNEEQLLIGTNSRPIYRRSFLADYYIYDLKKGELTPIANHPVMAPTFSNDGTKIAYAHRNNLFIYDIAGKTTTQITHDGSKNQIINGISDWVYEEEFSIVKMFEWSKDGDKIAYIKFDESQVPEYSMNVYGTGLYPSQDKFKYPKAGEKNAEVSLYIYEIESNSSHPVDLSEFKDFYIPRIKWTNDNQYLSAQIVNRHQNDIKLYFIDGSTQAKKLVLNETDKTYIDIHDVNFFDDNHFIWMSERDGYNHLYHYDKTGKLVNQVTNGSWEVTDYYGIDSKTKTLFYQSVERGSLFRDIYSINLNGKNKQQLSMQQGTNNAVFSPDFDLYIHTYSSTKTAPVYSLNDTRSGKVIKEILNNKKLENTLKEYQLPEKEFIQIPSADGTPLNAWLLKPIDFDPNKQYPLLMYQYSGPGSQQVADKWLDANDYWHAMLTQKGYIIVTVDGRGTGFRGTDFKKVTQYELGKYEVEDQIEAAKYFGKMPYINADRIGIWGWSYGGFMSTNCLFQANDVFKMAIAVAPVTSWRFYDTVYTERFMTTPQENPGGYDNNSPITHAEKLTGNYLLIHGTADDNVHVQNAMVLINKLVSLNKDFDWLIYPDKNHGIYGGKTREQLYTKMTNYLLEKL